MNKIIPFFTINNQRYEIKKTRYLIAEYEKIQEQSVLTDEEQENVIKLDTLVNDVQRIGNRLKEIEEKYFETFDDVIGEKYQKAKAVYEQALERLTKFEIEHKSMQKVEKMSVDTLEQIAILGLAEQYFDKDLEKAKQLWCEYVEEVGKSVASDWLGGMAQCLFAKNDEDDETSFLAIMRKKEQAKTNMKNGLQSINRKNK